MPDLFASCARSRMRTVAIADSVLPYSRRHLGSRIYVLPPQPSPPDCKALVPGGRPPLADFLPPATVRWASFHFSRQPWSEIPPMTPRNSRRKTLKSRERERDAHKACTLTTGAVPRTEVDFFVPAGSRGSTSFLSAIAPLRPPRSRWMMRTLSPRPTRID